MAPFMNIDNAMFAWLSTQPGGGPFFGPPPTYALPTSFHCDYMTAFGKSVSVCPSVRPSALPLIVKHQLQPVRAVRVVAKEKVEGLCSAFLPSFLPSSAHTYSLWLHFFLPSFLPFLRTSILSMCLSVCRSCCQQQ